MTPFIRRKAVVTTVKYVTLETVDGVSLPKVQPDTIFRGAMTYRGIEQQLRKRLGPDISFKIVGVNVSEHHFALSFEDFIRYASIVDDEVKGKKQPLVDENQLTLWSDEIINQQ